MITRTRLKKCKMGHIKKNKTKDKENEQCLKRKRNGKLNGKQRQK